MKKIFFYASLLALATSCTNEFDSLDVQDEKAQGISFKSEIVESRMMWEDNGAAYEPFWYAEMDRINVYGAGCLSVGDPASGSQTKLTTVSAYKNIADAYQYKATQSKKNGVFTSLNIAETYNFAGDKEAAFVATYPVSVNAVYESGANLKLTGWLPNAAQTQTGLKGDNKAQVMYALTKATRENSYDAVGETVNLKFERPLKAFVFTTANADEYTVAPTNGTSIFGNLNTISIETKGYDKVATDGGLDTKNGDILPTALSYSDATLLVDTASMAATIAKAEAATDINKITLNINEEWNDDALAIISVVPNERKEFATADEAVEIVYSFDNIDLTHKFASIPKGSKINGYVSIPALDIQNYTYLVTKGNGGTERTLIVNGGENFTFSDIFSEGKKVKWVDEHEADGEIDLTSFDNVIVDSDVILSDSEFALLNQFTNLTNLTLKGNTEIKTKALEGLTALTYINMPAVTTIAADAFNASFQTVLLPAFDFSVSKTVTEALLDAQTLETLDMSGVKSMKASFPNEGFTLDGFTSLKNLTVQEGLEVGASAFKGCTNLTKIDKAVNLVGASAFEESGITELMITNDVIPANAFKNCSALTKVTGKAGATLKPVEVGNNAFNGATSIVYLDLSSTTYVGEGAFMGATNYLGAYLDETKKLNILYVGAKEVGANAFNGATLLTYIEFTNLTVPQSGMLINISGLKEVKFKQVLATPASTKKVTAVFDKILDGTTLFLNQKQTSGFYDGDKFYVNGDKSEAAPVETDFARIQFE